MSVCTRACAYMLGGSMTSLVNNGIDVGWAGLCMCVFGTIIMSAIDVVY